jgi:hypothetical protein
VLPDLRINAPLLEPDPVLLEQLSQLSRVSAPRVGSSRATRSVMSAATVLVVAAVSWLTGTMPGIASPFDRQPSHQPTQQHAPPGPSGDLPRPGEAVPPGPAVVPPGQAKPQQDNGNHTGQTKPHQNSGNHTGQTKPHQNSGNHTGQTKPHQNSGNHTGQTKPHQDSDNDNGNHAGQAVPTTPAPGAPSEPPENNGQGNGNGHVK